MYNKKYFIYFLNITNSNALSSKVKEILYMNYTINSEKLSVTVSTKGGEMQSIRTNDGTEYLWQGDPNTWPDRALNLFPYVGR